MVASKCIYSVIELINILFMLAIYIFIISCLLLKNSLKKLFKSAMKSKISASLLLNIV